MRPEISPPAGKILIGTASWSDPGFVEKWYPKGMAAGDRLSWYAQYFEMVEVNSTFYSVPEPRLVERWCRATPAGFTFDVKLHQLFSFHATAAKLLPPDLQKRVEIGGKGKVKSSPALREAMLDIFLRSMSILQKEEKLGLFLLQLSPAFSPAKHELGELIPLFDRLRSHRVAVELRNRNWVTGPQLEATVEFLREQRVAFVNVDTPGAEHFTIMPAGLNEITRPGTGYLRLHGRDAKAYLTGKTVAARFNYDYSDNEIDEIAERARALAGKAKEVHVVFNNNALDFAPRAASRLRTALGQIFTPPPQTAELF